MPKHYCFSSLMPKLSLRGSIYSTAEGQISHQIYCGMLLCAFFFCSLSFMDAYLLTKWAKIRRIFTSWSSQDNKNIKIIRFCFCVLELSLACWNIIFAIPLTCMHHQFVPMMDELFLKGIKGNQIINQLNYVPYPSCSIKNLHIWSTEQDFIFSYLYLQPYLYCRSSIGTCQTTYIKYKREGKR